jgi:Ca-activated chloride channel homolog
MSTDIAPIEADPAAEPDGGLGALTTSRGNLPLETVDVRAAITGLFASVELTQGFRNPFDVPLEATYIFPLPDRAAVTAMRMEAAGRVVEGMLKERAQARAEYDQAIAHGKQAAIAEEDRPDVFTMRAGNIAPGERVTVRLTLAQPLPYQDGAATFRFPLVVAPRYIPGRPLDGEAAGSGVAADTGAVPDASRISPPVLLPGFPNPVRLTLRAEINPAGLPLAGISCSLHDSTVARLAGGRTTVTLRPGQRLDRDFILRMTVARPDQIATSLVLTQDPGEEEPGGTFSLTFVPPDGPGRPRPRDVVLVLDRSGSMHGWKMVAARRAAARIVDTLTDADRFAVLCFDHGIERVPDASPGLAWATDRNRFRAIEHLARTEARGGTEMLEPLADAGRLLAGATEPGGGQPAADRDRVLVLVTDGQVGNEDQILGAVGQSLAGVRIHVIGIDQAVNAGFLSRLAGAGRGRCELVESQDQLDQAAASIHRRIGAPLVTALTLAGDGLQIEAGSVAPSLPPDLFPGAPVTMSGRWRGQPGGTVIARGATPDGAPFETVAPATAGGPPAGAAIWARAHLRDLEDRYASLPGYDPGELGRLERQITDVSLRYGVLCRFTAFVAVDSRVVTGGGVPHRVTQPVELPAGWNLNSPSPAHPVPGGPAASGPTQFREQHRKPYEHAAERSAAEPGETPVQAAAPAAAVPSGPPLRSVPAPSAPAPGGPAGKPRHATRSRGPASVLAGSGGGRSGGPQPGRPSGSARLLAARDQVADEVAALRLARDATAAERLRFLADLATRLTALLTWLAGEPAGAGDLAGLTELAARLQACDAPRAPRDAEPDALWDEAIRVLTTFAQPRAGDPGGGDRGTFWKRPR